MTAHTPGPWAVDSAGKRVFHAASGSLVGVVDSECSHEQSANARLIAAAPALLAALRIVADCVADSDGGTTLGSYEMGKVRAALAKADVCLPTASKVST